ncbi:MAG: Fic family protein [Oscillospiraceae bacterium]|nr:Fic family protein [Oscillospiraceae bacterium]
MNQFPEIQELLQQRADLYARLNLLPYDGTPEIKENSGGRYLYIRKRVGSRITSTYIDVYSDTLYQLLLRNNAEAKTLRKQIRKVEKSLAEKGFAENELAPDVLLNLDFARINMKLSIYEQAVLEGVATSYPQTEDIIENGKINGVTASDVQKILNLKHAWEFILDKDVLQVKSDYSILCHIAKLVNEGFFANGGRIRGVPVTIGGTSYIPPLPIETIVLENILEIINSEKSPVDIAIDLCLYCMKTQVFNDGNKRASVIFANHYLIANAGGLLVIPEKCVPQFKSLLVRYYEDKDTGEIREFLKNSCHKNFR